MLAHEYGGLAKNTFRNSVGASTNYAATTAATSAVLGLGAGVAAPIAAGLSVGGVALNAVKDYRTIRRSQSARLNSRIMEYGARVVEANRNLDTLNIGISNHELCRKIYRVLQVVGHGYGVLTMFGDIYANVWFLKKFWNMQEQIQKALANRNIMPFFQSGDPKQKELWEALDSGYGCVSIFNKEMNRGIGMYELQEIHNPVERARIKEIEARIHEHIQNNTNEKDEFKLVQDALQTVLSAPHTFNAFTQNATEQEQNFNLLKKYSGGRQLLMSAKLLGVTVQSIKSKDVDMISSSLPKELDLFWVTATSPLTAFSTLMHNFWEGSDGTYLNNVLSIYKEKYEDKPAPITHKMREIDSSKITSNDDEYRARFAAAQQDYVTRMLQGTYYPLTTSHLTSEKISSMVKDVVNFPNMFYHLCYNVFSKKPSQ
jgi:hypothetical protein